MLNFYFIKLNLIAPGVNILLTHLLQNIFTINIKSQSIKKLDIKNMHATEPAHVKIYEKY